MGFYGLLVLTSFLISSMAMLGCMHSLGLAYYNANAYGEYAAEMNLASAKEIIMQSARQMPSGFYNWSGAVSAALKLDGLYVTFLSNTTAVVSDPSGISTIVTFGQGGVNEQP